jgi:peptide/nickel transport system substrate-binding protein
MTSREGEVVSDADLVLTRQELLRYGAAGAVAVAVGGTLSGRSLAALPRVLATTPKSGGTLKFARSIAPTTLDPANTIIAGDIYTLDKIFEPLFVTSPAGKLTPWLATGYTVSKDKKTYTFHLRPGVKWSNGKPLTSADVAFSLNRSRKNPKGPLSFLDSAITSIGPSGSSKVVAHLTEPWAPFISDISAFSNAIIPANYGGMSAAAFFKNPVGTGPFTVTGFTPDAPSLTLKKNPHYWQSGKPYLDAVTFSFVDDDNQRLLQLRGGQADVIDLVPPSQVTSLKSASNIHTLLSPSWQVDLLVLNEKDPHFADRNVRRAILQAIDTTALAHAGSFGTAKPGGSFFPPSLQYYSKGTKVLPHSLAAAKADLAKSKYPKGFSTELLIDGGVQKWRAFAQIIQSQLKPLGINVKIRPLDHAAFESAFQKFDYKMFIDYAINDISDPDEMASFELDYKDGGSSSYWSSYNSPSVTRLVRAAQREFNPTKRAKLYAQIQDAVAQDAPFVPLDYPPYINAHSTKVNGFAVNPGGAYRLETVWLA